MRIAARRGAGRAVPSDADRELAHLAHLVSAPATARWTEVPGATPSHDRAGRENDELFRPRSPAPSRDEAPVEKDRTRNISPRGPSCVAARLWLVPELFQVFYTRRARVARLR